MGLFGEPERFAPGYRNAKYLLLAVAGIGDLLQGGLVFGWNALALMLKQQGMYSEGCAAELADQIQAGKVIKVGECKSQNNSLVLLWTLAIFAVNFGPSVVGFVLDKCGPKITALLGVFMNVFGMVLLGCSHTSGFDALIPGALLVGVGGITYHLAQLHISSLFPRKRGLISSLFVAGFTGCCIIFFILYRIYEDLGGSRAAYRGVMIFYGAVFCGLWAPLMLWLMPMQPFRVGEVYVFPDHSWLPQRRMRAQVEARHVSIMDLPDLGKVQSRKHKQRAVGQLQPEIELQASDQPNGGAELSPAESTEYLASSSAQEGAVVTDGLIGRGVGSDDASWLSPAPRSPGSPSGNPFQDIDLEGGQAQQNGDLQRGGKAEEPASPAPGDARHPPLVAPEPEHNVVWGPLVFEPRRFVELRKQDFWTQLKSTESLGMGLFYTLNVFCMQFYLGTVFLQLEYKGDTSHAYTDLASILPTAAFVTIPIIAWMLDTKGYGYTLGAINLLAVLTSAMQALPVLWIQALTLVVWTAARFFLYSSYFTIFGVLFGFTNFGKMVAIDNTINGLFGLLQLPLAKLGINRLNGNFTAINIAQVIVLLPLFVFCWFMRKVETEDLVPIRPMEGEELPVDMHPPVVHKVRRQASAAA